MTTLLETKEEYQIFGDYAVEFIMNEGRYLPLTPHLIQVVGTMIKMSLFTQPQLTEILADYAEFAEGNPTEKEFFYEVFREYYDDKENFDKIMKEANKFQAKESE